MSEQHQGSYGAVVRHEVTVRCGRCSWRGSPGRAPTLLVLRDQEVTPGRGDFQWVPALVTRGAGRFLVRRRPDGSIDGPVTALRRPAPDAVPLAIIGLVPKEGAPPAPEVRERAKTLGLDPLGRVSGGVELRCPRSHVHRVKLLTLYQLAEHAVARGRSDYLLEV